MRLQNDPRTDIKVRFLQTLLASRHPQDFSVRVPIDLTLMLHFQLTLVVSHTFERGRRKEIPSQKASHDRPQFWWRTVKIIQRSASARRNVFLLLCFCLHPRNDCDGHLYFLVVLVVFLIHALNLQPRGAAMTFSVPYTLINDALGF